MTVTDADIAELATLLNKGRDNWIPRQAAVGRAGQPDGAGRRRDDLRALRRDSTVRGATNGATGHPAANRLTVPGRLRFNRAGSRHR
jgi:hypothetical protein